MRASEFEFRQRFWFIALIFCVAFGLYRFQHSSTGAWLARRWLGLGAGEVDERFIPFLRGLFAAGAGFAALGALLRTWAAAYLQSDVVHDQSLHAERMVADGPYRHLRNPLYLGILLLALGMAPIAPPAGALWMIVALAFFQRRLIGREEALLLATQGEPYRRFIAAVPRWFPALRPRLPASGKPPQWRQAFLGEAFSWFFAAAIGVFAATLDVRIFGYSCGVALLLYPLAQRAGMRRLARHGSTHIS